MEKIFNLSNHPVDLERFKGGSSDIREFMMRHRLDGIELIQSQPWSGEKIPQDLIRGMHLRFWPLWLNFWQGNQKELDRQFESLEAMKQFYGGETREALVEYYRNEIRVAKRIGVKYAVFHVSNVQPEHCFSYRFTYSSEEVVEASVELLNEVFEGFEGEFLLLFENLWWPGLTLLDQGLARKLLQEVRYPHKGFMLDISHIMNTNLELKDEEEAAEYILKKVGELGDLASAIKGIHLNSSVSGEYVKSQMDNREIMKKKGFFERYCDAYLHILKIDRHVPFEHPSIRQVIDRIRPEFLVYEFLTEELEELEGYMDVQNRVLGF